MQDFPLSTFLFTHDFDFRRTYCVYAMPDSDGKRKPAQVLLKFYFTKQKIFFLKHNAIGLVLQRAGFSQWTTNAS